MNESFRLAPQQRRVWNLERELGEGRLKILATAEIEGAGILEPLAEAVPQVAGRHQIFALRFESPENGAEPFMHPAAGPRVERSAGKEAGTGLHQRLAEHRFSPVEGPLLLWGVESLGENRHELVLCASALAADGRSLALLMREIHEVATALDAERDPRLEDAVQYLDAAPVLNDLLEAEELESARAHWRRARRGELRIPPALTRADRPPAPGFEPARHRLPITPELGARLREIAERGDVDLATTLLAAWQALLARLHGGREVSVAVAVDGVTHPSLAAVVGPLERSLPLCPEIDLDGGFFDFLTRVASESEAAARAQDAFDGSRANPTPPPWAFSHHRLPALPEAPARVLRPRGLETWGEPFALRLAVVEPAGDESFDLHLDHDTSRFDPEDALRLGEELITWLESLVADPERPLGRQRLLGPSERRQLVVEGNDTARPRDAGALCHHLFEEQAARTPDAIAVVFRQHHMTYRALDAGANQIAHYLRSRGVGPEAVVGICLERAPALVLSVLGVLKAGAAYVPLDPTYPDERLAFMQRESGLELMLTQEDLLPEGGDHGGDSRFFCLDADRHELAAFARDAPARLSEPEHLAYVIYTSGSTGRPKGTMITHGGLANYLAWCLEAYGLKLDGRVPFFTPLGFDLTVTSLFPPLSAGGRLIVLSEERGIDALVEALVLEREFDLLKLTPAHLELLNLDFEAQASGAQLRALVVGGDALYGESLEPWQRLSPTTRVINEYGPTETVVGCATWERAADELPETGAEGGSLPIGRPLANTRLYLVDRDFEPLPVGVVGELLVAGQGVARGYLHLPGRSAERFVPDPFATEPGSRLYRTGDLARFRADGDLEFVGRNDHQVKVRGFRVELGEIEAVLRARDGVRDAVVVVRNESGGAALAAYVVPSGGAPFAPAPLLQALKLHLPDHMVPDYFTALDALPLTANGKVDRRALPPPSGSRGVAARYVAPKSPVEQTLAEVWCEFLEAERVGLEDNFFDLGGHSLKASRVVSRARKLFPVEPTVADLFENPTLAGFAQRLEERLVEKVSQLSEAEAEAVLGDLVS